MKAKIGNFKIIVKDTLKIFGIYVNEAEKRLSKLEKEFKTKDIKNNGKKVLFTHSFSIYEPSFIHDKLMAFALKLRGFEILATFCDGVQDIECNVYGGVWGGKENFSNNCNNCQKKSNELWSFLEQQNIHKYSKYLNSNDYDSVEKELLQVSHGKWLNYNSEGCDIGLWAKDILVNNYVVADYRLIENNESLGRNHLKNLLLTRIACKRIIKDVKPDRIISNDSYYGMWKMWELLAKEFNIPFYSHWSGTRVGGWCYAHNDASMHLDFSESWKNYSKINLTDTEKQRVEEWLNNRLNGKEMIIDTASLASFKNEDFDLTKIDTSKPTALLSANVVWDLAALNKEIFTENMEDWIIKTIYWFEEHSEYQLIVKPHPAEFFPGIPETKETVESMIKKEFTTIPSNIFILSPKVSISVYDLFPISKVGLVFTTSLGMEMPARGIPVISAGLSHYRGYGFTYDPSSIEEYFDILENILSQGQIIDRSKIIDLAMKFIKFNFFHYFGKTGLIEFSFGKEKKNVTKIKINDIDELREGKNKHFDYIVNCIVNGEKVLSENRWMEES